MIEVEMVHRMIKRALIVAPALIAGLWLAGSTTWAFSGAVGLAMTLLNLWLSARIIGGVAEHHPQLLLAAGLAALTMGLALLTGITLALRAADLVFFPVTGFVLLGAHFVLVLWEAAGAYGKTVDARS